MEDSFTPISSVKFFYEEMPEHKRELLLNDLTSQSGLCSVERFTTFSDENLAEGPSQDVLNSILNYSKSLQMLESAESGMTIHLILN